MENVIEKKETIRLIDPKILEPKVSRYPEVLTEEIRKDYTKLNIPLNDESKRSIQRVDEP